MIKDKIDITLNIHTKDKNKTSFEGLSPEQQRLIIDRIDTVLTTLMIIPTTLENPKLTLAVNL